MDTNSIVGVLLAAGQSKRFGDADKLMAPYRRRPLAMHAAGAMAALPFKALIGVVRPYSEAAELHDHLIRLGFTIAVNEDPGRGVSSSIACAVRTAAHLQCQGILICLGDMPNVTSHHLATICAMATTARSTIASFDGIARSPPCFIGGAHFDTLLSLKGDEGARILMRDAAIVEADATMLHDVDEAADLRAAPFGHIEDDYNRHRISSALTPGQAELRVIGGPSPFANRGKINRVRRCTNREGEPMERFAHSVEGQPEKKWEPLSHHLALVGRRGADFAARFGASQIALAMGSLHDIGKMALSYQLYIRRPSDQAGPKGPDHSSAGAKEAVRLYGGGFGRMMAFGIAGHHAGLMDGSGHEGGTLSARLAKDVEDYAGWQDHVTDLPTAEALRAGLPAFDRNRIEPAFSSAFFVRMLFSCLVDADFLETEAFDARSRGEEVPPRGGELTPEHVERVCDFVAGHRRDNTPVNRLRSEILDHADAKAALPPGLFTLTVPTGGGKTLTSLSFAMRHAAAHGLRRIIYAIPFTSIIEQTADIFREQVGLGDAVLEHHSSFDWDRQPPARGNDQEEEGAAGLAKLRRDVENWDAPVIVTTAVQFFESLFAARTSKARKLHNLAGSVIILDEAQSLPVALLRPCMAVIDELARNYGASIILCTATQPALRTQDQALRQTDMMKKNDVWEGLHIPDERELAPDPQRLYQALKRVNVEWRRDPVDDAEIAGRFADRPQMLCIVNSRAHARDLFEAIRGQEGAVHLTTLMCARHRRVVLAKAREALEAGEPVRLIATSLIEAGVDISFPEVWRAAAGLASIAQAAGRCNRSGELEGFGRTVVFEPAPVEGRKPVPDMIRPFYQAAKNVLRGGAGGDDVLGLDAVRDYFRWLYWEQGHAALDAATLDGVRFPIIPAIRDTARKLDFPFASIARAFRMIDDEMDPVIVPWGETEAERKEIDELIRRVEGAPFPPAGAQRKLQQYVVPVPSKVREAMLGTGAVQAIRPDDYGDRFVVLRSPSLYDPALGLRLDDPTWRSSEDNLF